MSFQSPYMSPFAGRHPVYLQDVGMAVISEEVQSIRLNGRWLTTLCPQCGIGNPCNYTCRGPVGFWVNLVPVPSEFPVAAPSYVMQSILNPATVWYYETPTDSNRDSPFQTISHCGSSSSHQTLISPTPDPRDRNRTSLGGTVGTAEGGIDNERAVRADGNYRPVNNNKRRFCAFCFKKGKGRHVYGRHALRDSEDNVACPVLLRYVCGNCGATGHTESYCPAIHATPNFQTRQ